MINKISTSSLAIRSMEGKKCEPFSNQSSYFNSHPQSLNLLVFLTSQGAQLLAVLTGQLLRLDVQSGAAALTCQLMDRRTRRERQTENHHSCSTVNTAWLLIFICSFVLICSKLKCLKCKQCLHYCSKSQLV